ncbi:MAG TPA: deoxyribonuclease V [bacterium]|nr:deoxyribonuclease V [bacterium]
MKPVIAHRWDLSPAEAVALQKELAARVVLADDLPPPRTVCGLDVSYNLRSDRFYAVAALLSYPDLEVIEIAEAADRSAFPYIPGLLSFREIPVLAAAMAKLTGEPDLLACDGQGLAHPRRFGLACHLGVLYDRPSIGLAKSRLVGEGREPGAAKGRWTWLTHNGERIGQLVRTRDNTAPLYVSPGHRVGFHTARALALALCPRYRIPETTRVAHQAVNRLRRRETV